MHRNSISITHNRIIRPILRWFTTIRLQYIPKRLPKFTRIIVTPIPIPIPITISNSTKLKPPPKDAPKLTQTQTQMEAAFNSIVAPLHVNSSSSSKLRSHLPFAAAVYQFKKNRYPLMESHNRSPISTASSLVSNHASTHHSLDLDVKDRIGSVKRVTNETNVSVELNLDGVGSPDSNTGIPFLDHMLDQLASHGLFDVHVKAVGDIHIDDHHTNEDVGLAIGTALLSALGDRKGINRFGDFTAPLDEALVHVSLDLSGRPHLSYDLQIPTARVGTYDTQLVEHFFQSLVNTSGMTLHIRQLAGKNSHHIIEATFKAFARALRQATEYDPRRRGTVPSSKGVLSRS